MGIHLVDSPVRGTALSCETGTLYLMVGASDEAFTAAKGVLDTIGSLSLIHIYSVTLKS